MWDAQQQYWYGYEWTKHLPGNTGQPTLDGNSSSNYAQNNTDPRFYNEAFTNGADNKATHTSCKDLPNVNEMTWYAAKGEPRWDADELWTTMGHLYKGGMWFKKKANISGFNPNTAVDGTDWRANNKGKTWSVSQTLPSAADANNYFYLPALGQYQNNHLAYIGNVTYFTSTGSYWSSSAHPWFSEYAYELEFNSGVVVVSYNNRNSGFRVEPTCE